MDRYTLGHKREKEERGREGERAGKLDSGQCGEGEKACSKMRHLGTAKGR